jgi:predicted 3-demethylubiquinone-9 3-methyltransferase (glyoxalase superfamily)
MQTISPFLWFDDQAEQAAEFYVSLFPNSRILGVSRYGEGAPQPAGTAMSVSFVLDGLEVQALNGGPEFHFTEAISLFVKAETQEEIDRLWDRLTEGGEPSQCGWLKDRYGVSWQIVPNALMSLLADPDPGRSSRAMHAMLGMRKLDIAALRAAADE